MDSMNACSVSHSKGAREWKVKKEKNKNFSEYKSFKNSIKLKLKADSGAFIFLFPIKSRKEKTHFFRSSTANGLNLSVYCKIFSATNKRLKKNFYSLFYDMNFSL